MSAIVGERDRLLRSTVPRNINPTAGKVLLLDFDPSAVHYDADGDATTSTITFTARPVGFDATVMWSITAGGALIGLGKNVRTMAASSMTAPSVKVTITAIYEGQAYIAYKTIYKVKDGKTGADGSSATLTPEALVAALEGRIVRSSLYADLRSTIDLIDGPASIPTTVAGQIKKETDLRVGAINQEIADRIAALVAEAGARTTYVQSYTFSKQETTSALSIQATAITAAYTSYADTAKTLAIAAASADVRNYAYSKGDIDSSEATQTSSITASYRSYADGIGQQAVSNATAYVQQYAYSKATSDSALSAMASTLRSEFAAGNGVTVAYLNNFAFSKAETNTAISNATQTLSTTVAGHTTTLQTQSQSINGLSAQYTVKIDNNGRVSGFGLASTPVDGAAYSAFIINADAFSVGAPGVANKQMFMVGQVNGQTAMVLRGDMYADGAITARSLRIGTSDNIMPDPQFRDLGWWGLTGAAAANVVANQWRDAGVNSPWLDGASLTLGVNAGIIISSSKTFAVTQGAQYRIEVQTLPSSDFVGSFSIWFLAPGSAFYGMGTPSIGAWSDGSLDVQFNSSSAKLLRNDSTNLTVPFHPQNSQCQIVIKRAITSGSIEVGSVRITRVADSTLIGPGVVQTKHLDIATGGDIHSGQWGFDLGDGFWLEGEGRGHGARMSIGRQGGRKIIIDPANNRLELVDPQIGANMTSSVAPGQYVIQRNSNQRFINVYAGTFTASAGNASPNLSYAWSVSPQTSDITANLNVTSGSQVIVYVTGIGFSGQEFYVTVNCIVSDLNNSAARRAEAQIIIQIP